MADIFFSYKRQDRRKVKQLVLLLEKAGFTVWWDPAVEAGKRFKAIIREELDKASCVIVGWSAKSVKSKWVRYEASAGRARDILVPISLDGTEPPLGFQQIHAAPFRGWKGDSADLRVRRLIGELRRLVVHPEQRSTGRTKARQSVTKAESGRGSKRRGATPNKKVFLIAAATTEEWQLALNNHILLSSRRANLSCTVLVPAEDHFLDEHRALQREVLKDASDYSGGIIIISGWPDRHMIELVKFAEELDKPLVLVDQNPPPGAKRKMPWNMSYVSVSDSAGGRLAAEAVLRLSQEHAVRQILVISGFAKQKRYEAFRDVISEKLKSDIVISEDGKFDRWISENVIYNKLEEALRRGRPFDVIFCTADSMTLGCLDAINRIRNWPGHARPRVVGYDGTVTTQHLAENGSSHLVRIVVQDTKELARIAVGQLMQMRRGEEFEKIVWVTPHLFPRLKEGAVSVARKKPLPKRPHRSRATA